MIARRTLLPIANVGVGAVLGLIALHIVAQYFHKPVYGQFEAAYAILGILFLFVDLSMNDAHVKRVSEGMHAGDCFVTFTAFRIVGSLVFVLVATGAYLVYTLVVGRRVEDTTIPALVFCMLYFVLKSLQTVAQSTFEARLEQARAQLGGLVETVVRIGLTILAAFVFAAAVYGSGPLAGRIDPDEFVWRWIRENPAGAIALAWAAGALVALGVLLAYLRRSIERGRFRWEILRSYFAFALPLFIPNAFALFAFFIDRVVLAFFGTSVDTADFAGHRRIVGVIEGLGVAVGLVLFPAISSAAAANNVEATKQLVTRATRYLSLAVLPLTAFLIAFPEAVIPLVLSDDWAGTGRVLSILAFTVYMIVLSRPHVNFLMGHGHTRALAKVGIVGATLTVVLNLVLVPDDIRSIGLDLPGLKAVGAAIASLVAVLVTYVMLRSYSRRLEGYRGSTTFWKHGAAAVAMVGAVHGLRLATGIATGPWYTLLVLAFAGGLAYVATLVLVRELTRDDWRFVQDTLHPGEMWRYVRGELLHRRREP